jgi:transposase
MRLRAASNGERLLVCYEAGYDGFWLARSLVAEGIDCRVLDPASLQVNRRARRVKTDRIDVLMLLRALIAIDRGERHVCAIVNVPSIEEEDARRSHRERQRLVRERTAHINRIKGLLFGQGIRGVEPARRKRIDFSLLRTGEGHPLADRLKAELEREYARLDLIDTQLRAVEAERDTADTQDAAVERKRNMLLQLRGHRTGERCDPCAGDFRTIFRQSEAIGVLPRLDAKRLRQRISHEMPGHFQGRQQFCAARHDRGRVAVAQISTGERSRQMV